ncbi:hypothetical protein [Glycomyces salinus]|uniref:hypothetical protein n=1 Tax=Glycomyces salinus TaxID=980294 RepID=UPI0018EDCEF9|nr:hypothetical protein [Glycomyces salinus]
MRWLTTIAAAVLLVGAACSSGEEEGSVEGDAAEETTEVVEPAPSPTAHLAVTEPFELALQPPDGFTADDAERDVLVADEHITYNFALDDSHADSRITVTSYLLPEESEAEDYEAQAALIVEYDNRRGNTISDVKHTPTLVHGYSGLYRFAKYEVDGEEISQQNHYLFAGQHLIQITCQWNFDFDQVYQGCKDLTEVFPYPDEWPLPYRTDA